MMDDRLKQRLLGAMVITILAIIIVPEIVKDKDDPGEIAVAIPAADTPTPNPMPLVRTQQPDLTTISLPDPEPTAPVAPSGAAPTREPVIEQQALPGDSTEQELAQDTATDFALPFEQAPLPSPEDAASSIAVQESVVAAAAEPDPALARVAREAAERIRKPPEKLPPPNRPQQPAPTAQASPPTSRTPSPLPANREPVLSKPAPVELPPIELIARASPPVAGSPPPTQATAVEPLWMVQAGSFEQQENALLLRDRLRAKHFPATVETVVSNGRTLYRVRIGPQATRGDSERVRTRLQEEANVLGNILPIDG